MEDYQTMYLSTTTKKGYQKLLVIYFTAFRYFITITAHQTSIPKQLDIVQIGRQSDQEAPLDKD